MHTRRRKTVSLSMLIFLLIELILYVLILTVRGTLSVACSYVSILVCFLYALLHLTKDNRMTVGALACTMDADFFLVVCSPAQWLLGMIFFLAAQTLYAIYLHRLTKSRPLLLLRVVLIAAIEAAALIVLRDKADALALVSVCYYANLAANIIASFTRLRRDRLLPIGFVLFLLCDTVIGLQVAAGTYLSISRESWLYRILFVNFNLSWFFYLPSQVLIALSCVLSKTESSTGSDKSL